MGARLCCPHLGRSRRHPRRRSQPHRRNRSAPQGWSSRFIPFAPLLTRECAETQPLAPGRVPDTRLPRQQEMRGGGCQLGLGRFCTQRGDGRGHAALRERSEGRVLAIAWRPRARQEVQTSHCSFRLLPPSSFELSRSLSLTRSMLARLPRRPSCSGAEKRSKKSGRLCAISSTAAFKSSHSGSICGPPNVT